MESGLQRCLLILKMILMNSIFCFLRRLFVVLVVLLQACQFPIHAKRTQPLIWNMAELEQMKNSFQSERGMSIIKEADNYCLMNPVSVTDKTRTFSPDNHYYCSMSIYWWPDPKDLGGKYIQKDGFINPESYEYDYSRLLELCTRCKVLSKAFYLTKEKKYYKAFIKQIRVWFLEEETYMYPNFIYSQVVPGYSNNIGKSSGMIDAYLFNDVLESIRLVQSVKRINRRTMNGLKNWFLAFVEWSDKEYGEIMRDGLQNISLAYDVIVINMLLFAGDSESAKLLVDSFADNRINKQIEEDGSQPNELERTRAIFYSLYNLEHIMDFCFLVRGLDREYYNKHSERIEKALLYIKQYTDNPEICPYQQVTSWEECRRMMERLLDRRSVLLDKN